MEYFNFSDASDVQGVPPPLDLDELSSLYPEYNQDEANDCFDSLFFDKSHSLPADPAPPVQQGPIKLKLINDVEIEVIPQLDDPSLDYPMFRAKNPCDLCSRMGLDCFLASRGAMITGCTCCISLYKDCSFTHPKLPKGFVSNFRAIGEDKAETVFGRENQRSLKSFDEARPRKTGARFPRDAVKILKQWLAEHADHPYPNEREKDELKQVTGLKRSQISNWLANARRRGKVRPADGSDPSSPLLGAIDIPGPSNNLSELNPLDRWKASPPENEPASMTAIARAVTSTPMPSHQTLQRQNSLHNSRASSRKNSSSESATNLSMFREPSISSFETRESSTNSDLTHASSRSNQSKRSFSSGERRRRRRAPMTQRAAAQATKTRSARIFQCTFCTDTFPAKYDWQRHEKSLHLALERWTCCPEGGTYTVPSTGLAHCVFCNCLNPTPSHLESEHNFLVCQEQTVQERTFYRKDHLRQHLKLRHSAKFEKHMESWKTTTNEIKSACGFCPSKFTTWSQRADHLAAHFRNGADMSTWANGWGFDPAIERCVENAIPPYLIGHERLTMEPYVARMTKRGPLANTPMGNVRGRRDTPGSSGSGSGLTYGTSAPGTTPKSGLASSGNVTDSDTFEEPDQLTRDSNCWGRLEQELTQFITQFRLATNNSLPTDKQLQDKARLIIYEDDDPWNWTCADNQLWLDTFKWQHGVGGVTEGMRNAGLGVDIGADQPAAPDSPAAALAVVNCGEVGSGINGAAPVSGHRGGLMGYGRDGVRLLEQVEVMAPYVIKGGNKAAGSASGRDNSKGRTGAGGRGTGRGRRTTKAMKSAHAARSSRGGSSVSSLSSRGSLDIPLSGSGYDVLANNHSHNPNAGAMDLDFEGVDFGNLNLDLGMTGNDDGLGLGGPSSVAHLNMPTTSTMGYAPLSALQHPGSGAHHHQDDFFGGQGFEMHTDDIINSNNNNNHLDAGIGFGLDLNMNMSMDMDMGTTMAFNNNHNNDNDNDNDQQQLLLQQQNSPFDPSLALDLELGLDDMDMGAPLTRTDTCVSKGKNQHHDESQNASQISAAAAAAGGPLQTPSQQRSASMSTALDQRNARRTAAAAAGMTKDWPTSRHYSEGGGGGAAVGESRSGSVPDLSYMSEADVRALEGWTGGLQ